MFKKIQKYLLINNPPLWNTKVVPMTCFLLLIHLVFFVIGFFLGEMDFRETERNYMNKNQEIVVFFSVLISILTLILWLVYYFKNNGFKSFYPKNNWSLFKEWSIIFVVSLMLCTVHLSYLKGYDARIKSYYSEEEAIKRSETISKASIFYGTVYGEGITIDTIINDTATVWTRDYIVFNKKKYSTESLINKEIQSSYFFDPLHDSLTKIKVKNWLINGEKDSIKTVMKDYFKLIKEHDLETNLTEDKWFSMVYTPPTFIQKRVIAKRKVVSYNDYSGYEDEYGTVTTPAAEASIDTVNEYIKILNKERYVFNKAYLPADQLEYNYEKIAKIYIFSSATVEMLLVSLYFAIALSILIFSFRVTSGKNWLITLISMGIFNVVLGIFSAVFSEELIYLCGILALFLAVITYFVIVVIRKTKKGISAIALNFLLWLFPFFIPAVFVLVTEILRYIYPYRDYLEPHRHPYVKWMDDHAEAMGWLNLIFIVLMILLLSFKIKQWKGIAES